MSSLRNSNVKRPETGRVHKEHLRAMIRQEVTYNCREKYDWDGDGGLPTRADARFTAFAILDEYYGIDYRGLPKPIVGSSPEGSISLYFRKDMRAVGLSVVCGNVIECQRWSEDGAHIDSVVRLPETQPHTGYAYELDEVLDWLFIEE